MPAGDFSTPSGRRQRTRHHRAQVDALHAFLASKRGAGQSFDDADRALAVAMLDAIRESICANLVFVRPWLSGLAAMQVHQQVLFDVAANLPESTSIGPNEASLGALAAAHDTLVTLAET